MITRKWVPDELVAGASGLTELGDLAELENLQQKEKDRAGQKGNQGRKYGRRDWFFYLLHKEHPLEEYQRLYFAYWELKMLLASNVPTGNTFETVSYTHLILVK